MTDRSAPFMSIILFEAPPASPFDAKVQAATKHLKDIELHIAEAEQRALAQIPNVPVEQRQAEAEKRAFAQAPELPSILAQAKHALQVAQAQTQKLNPKQGVKVDVSERIISLEYEDTEAEADKVEITVDNFDLALFDDPLWRTGNHMFITWGYIGDPVPTREVVITSIKGSKQLKIEALAKSILMNKDPRSRVFENMTRAKIVEQIARENGYEVDLQVIEDTKHVFPHVVQANLTDAQFLKDLAAREGFQFYVDFDGLHFHRRKMGKAPVRTFIYYTDPGRGDVIDFNVENDVTVKPGAVTAKGRDTLEKKDISVTSNNENTDRATLAPIIEVVDPKTGRTTKQPLASEATVLTHAPNEEAAKREADGRFVKAQQTTVMLSMNCMGDPQVTAKQVIEIQGISKRLSGRYYISKAVHKVGTEYTMELTARTDGSHGTPGAKNAASDGNLNTKPEADKNALQSREVVDPKTGTTKIEYVKGDPNPKGET